MELKIPSPEQAYWGLRAMKTVALADGTLDDAELHLLASIQQIFGTTHETEQLSPITPEDLAREFPDPQLRQQLVQGLIVMSLIDGKANVHETDLVESFAQALEVSAPEVKDLRHLLKGEILHLRLDLARRFWLRDKVKDIWNTEGVRGIYKFMRGMIGQYEDTALAARYQALEHYPAGSLGRAYWEYCRANGFALPGEKGGAAEPIRPGTAHKRLRILGGVIGKPQGTLNQSDKPEHTLFPERPGQASVHQGFSLMARVGNEVENVTHLAQFRGEATELVVGKAPCIPVPRR